MNKGDIVYYAQILIQPQIFEILELSIRTVDESNPNDKWFVGTEKHTKHAYLFSFKDIDKCVFYDRLECLEKVKVAEDKYKRKDKMEVEYEEY